MKKDIDDQTIEDVIICELLASIEDESDAELSSEQKLCEAEQTRAALLRVARRYQRVSSANENSQTKSTRVNHITPPLMGSPWMHDAGSWLRTHINGVCDWCNLNAVPLGTVAVLVAVISTVAPRNERQDLMKSPMVASVPDQHDERQGQEQASDKSVRGDDDYSAPLPLLTAAHLWQRHNMDDLPLYALPLLTWQINDAHLQEAAERPFLRGLLQRSPGDMSVIVLAAKYQPFLNINEEKREETERKRESPPMDTRLLDTPVDNWAIVEARNLPWFSAAAISKRGGGEVMLKATLQEKERQKILSSAAEFIAMRSAVDTTAVAHGEVEEGNSNVQIDVWTENESPSAGLPESGSIFLVSVGLVGLAVAGVLRCVQQRRK